MNNYHTPTKNLEKKQKNIKRQKTSKISSLPFPIFQMGVIKGITVSP